MSEETYRNLPDQMKGLIQTPSAPVKTAKTNQDLQVLGKMTKKMFISFPTCPIRFSIRPMVLRGLSMPLNLGYQFLSKAGVVVDPQNNQIVVQGRPVLLPIPKGKTPIVASLRVGRRTQVEPGKTAWVEVTATNFQGVDSLDGLVESSPAFEEDHQVAGWRNAVQRFRNGQAEVAVFNPGPEIAMIGVGVIYGTVTRLKDGSRSGLMSLAGSETPAPQEREPSTKLPSWYYGPTTDGNRTQRARLIMETFGLHNNPLLTTDQQKADAVGLLLEYFDVFAWDGRPGFTPLVTHRIELKEIGRAHV